MATGFGQLISALGGVYKRNKTPSVKKRKTESDTKKKTDRKDFLKKQKADTKARPITAKDAKTLKLSRKKKKVNKMKKVRKSYDDDGSRHGRMKKKVGG